MAKVVKREKKPYHMGRWDVVILRASSELAESAGEISDVFFLGDYDNLTIVQDITASATIAGDTLDTKIDGSWDGTNFFNMGEFTQQAGNGSARTEIMQFAKGLAADVDAIVDITGDAGVAVVRPGMIPPYIRTTSVVVRDTGVDEAHTFSVTAHVQ